MLHTCSLVAGSPVTWLEVGVIYRWAWSALRRLYQLLSRWRPLSCWRRLRGTVVDNSTGRVVYTPTVRSRLSQLFTTSLSYLLACVVLLKDFFRCFSWNVKLYSSRYHGNFTCPATNKTTARIPSPQNFRYSQRTQKQTRTAGQKSRECPQKLELIASVFFELSCKHWNSVKVLHTYTHTHVRTHETGRYYIPALPIGGRDKNARVAQYSECDKTACRHGLSSWLSLTGSRSSRTAIINNINNNNYILLILICCDDSRALQWMRE